MADAAGVKAVKELPAKDFIGKPCKGTEGEAMVMIVRAWTWKGILLHPETLSAKGGGKPIAVNVTKISEEAVPAEKFEVPAGVKFKAYNTSCP